MRWIAAIRALIRLMLAFCMAGGGGHLGPEATNERHDSLEEGVEGRSVEGCASAFVLARMGKHESAK
jgi:hypothetical protein